MLARRFRPIRRVLWRLKTVAPVISVINWLFHGPYLLTLAGPMLVVILDFMGIPTFWPIEPEESEDHGDSTK